MRVNEIRKTRSSIFLFLILVLAILVRMIPVLTNAAWGVDLGIYYGIALRMIEKNSLIVDYNGWGDSYQYFPMLYLISLSLHILTGFDLLQIMVRVAPIIGGLTVLIFYMIVFELTRNRKISLISSALLAVAPFHVYQTSHAAPLTVGHLFMLLSLFLFIKYKENLRFLPWLMLSTVLLIISHHLTTYFYLITLAGIIVWRNFKYNISNKENLYDLCYLFVSSILTFSYWKFIAKPVYYSFMKNGLGLEPWQIIFLYFTSIILFFFTARVLGKSKLHSVLSKIANKWIKRTSELFISSFLILLSLEFIFLFFKIPATNVKMNITAIILSIPILTFASLSVAGIPLLSIGKNRSFFQGWLLVVFVSLIYSIMTKNTTLYPDRHIEYLMVPMCLPASLSIMEFGRKLEAINFRLVRRKIRRLSTEVAMIFILLMVILSNGITVYPTRYSLEFQDERFSEPCFSAIQWLRNNTDGQDTIATDLRLSDFVWAYGMNTTFDETNITWTCEDWRDCLDELLGKEKNYSRITYILIDDIMRYNVVCLSVFLSVHMSNESYEKFSKEPFELVYRNATYDESGNEVHWAEIYRVNWSYIDRFIANR